MVSLAESIPPELFKNILIYVGDEGRLEPCEDPTARREEMRHLSACSLTCVYWAQLTRKRMLDTLVLRSGKDLYGLRLLHRASSSDRLPSIGELLRELAIFYKLGDLPWFHNVSGLVASGLNRVYFHVLGPVPPAFTAGNTRRSVLHPLFFAVPRVFPMASFHKLYVDVYVEDIHFTHPNMLRNLLQDCKSLHPFSIYCINLTWDNDPSPATVPSSDCWTLSDQFFRPRSVTCSRCTDNTLAATMALSIPRHESSRRLHLSLADSSCLLDIIRASGGRDASAGFEIRSVSGFDDVQGCSAARLTPDCDLGFKWWHNHFLFYCIASRPGNYSKTRYLTHILIYPLIGNDLTKFREHIKRVDWDAFLRSVQKLPDLHAIVIQCESWFDAEEWHKCLAELVSLLREAWAGVDTLLQLYHGDDANYKLTQSIKLSTVLEGIDRMREEAAAHSSSVPDPTPELKAGPSNSHHKLCDASDLSSPPSSSSE
ncbi:hypothetical protein BDY19DRAFT_590732 [Irpex rosettiformis]|uniref:Uncharacterized protein n=1 Tax=Irpex rosettiformis TaxID=378272 RepID=A0ACB8UD55_9APHY|nr:hypothetical protein BDY19DRAFT_590732 [Irpex rosettiformis]